MKTKALSFAAILLLAVFVALLSSGLLLSVHHSSARSQIRDLVLENQALTRANSRLQLIQQLASRFGFDPRIVEIVYRHSCRMVDPSQPEWRQIQTPERMARIMLSLIRTESRGRVRAIGDGGKARGLTQIWVSTARQYGEVTAAQLLDPETNLEYSFRHLHYLLKRYRGNASWALAAWNQGEGRVGRLLRSGGLKDNRYLRKIQIAALLNVPLRAD